MSGESLEKLCKRLEHFETPKWAVEAILRREILTGVVIDPCAGTGVLTRAARLAGYHAVALDIHDWGFSVVQNDWLNANPEIPEIVRDASVLMNPPFSKAEAFVEKAFDYGARKLLCFQRFAWWESRARKGFWDNYPPNRIYICGDRAACWRHDIPEEQRGSGTPTAHAWFVWERGHPPGPLLGRIYKGDHQQP